MISSILDHKNVALANIGWVILHVWIALEIEESMGFLVIVLVIGGIFALSYNSDGKFGRRIMLLPSLLYLLVLPAVIGSVTGEMESSGHAWLDVIGPIIWVLIIPVTLLASTQEWTGIGDSVE